MQIDGVELIYDAVQESQRLVDELILGNIQLECEDIREFRGKPAYYDAIYSTSVLQYVEDKRAVLRDLNRMLRLGGRFVNLIPNRWCPARWLSYPHPLYSLLKFKRDIEAIGFREVQFESVNFVPPAIGRRLPYLSRLYPLERVLQVIPPTRWLGALALIASQKR